MMNGRKKGNTGAATDHGSDRKHPAGREVEKLIEATKGNRNEARDRCNVNTLFGKSASDAVAVGTL